MRSILPFLSLIGPEWIDVESDEDACGSLYYLPNFDDMEYMHHCMLRLRNVYTD